MTAPVYINQRSTAVYRSQSASNDHSSVISPRLYSPTGQAPSSGYGSADQLISQENRCVNNNNNTDVKPSGDNNRKLIIPTLRCKQS